MTHDELARHARHILDDEAFVEACNEVERQAMTGIRQAQSYDELFAARARLLAATAIRDVLRAFVDRGDPNQATKGRQPLA